eukprot:8312806-Pyramimonas_sp.AAC.1
MEKAFWSARPFFMNRQIAMKKKVRRYVTVVQTRFLYGIEDITIDTSTLSRFRRARVSSCANWFGEGKSPRQNEPSVTGGSQVRWEHTIWGGAFTAAYLESPQTYHTICETMSRWPKEETCYPGGHLIHGVWP